MTSTEIEPHNAAALAIRPGQDMWTEKQRAALGALGIRNATNADLAVFLHYAQKTGLDPFSRQIYMICRREKQGNDWVDKQTIQVGIDGFRVIRDRIARRDSIEVGYEDTVWYDDAGGRHDIWLRDEPPAGCTVVVLKNGRRYPGTLRFREYVQTKDEQPLPPPDAPAVIRQRGPVTVAEVIGQGEAAEPDIKNVSADILNTDQAEDESALPVEDPPDIEWPAVTRPGHGTPKGK